MEQSGEHRTQSTAVGENSPQSTAVECMEQSGEHRTQSTAVECMEQSGEH